MCTKDEHTGRNNNFCMCFKDKKKCYELESKESVLKFHTTRVNILIPIFVSALVFAVEIYSVYYVDKNASVNWLHILRLFNTTFVPSHIATTSVFLYQHFSLSNYLSNGGKMRTFDDMEIKVEYAGLTVVNTIILSVVYIICCFGVGFANQIFLLVLQCAYMLILWKYGIKSQIIIYKNPIKNVVSF